MLVFFLFDYFDCLHIHDRLISPQLIGIAECLKIINALYCDCLKTAGLPQDTVLDGLVGGLSDCLLVCLFVCLYQINIVSVRKSMMFLSLYRYI